MFKQNATQQSFVGPSGVHMHKLTLDPQASCVPSYHLPHPLSSVTCSYSPAMVLSQLRTHSTRVCLAQSRGCKVMLLVSKPVWLWVPLPWGLPARRHCLGSVLSLPFDVNHALQHGSKPEFWSRTTPALGISCPNRPCPATWPRTRPSGAQVLRPHKAKPILLVRYKYVTEPMTPKRVRPHQQAQVCYWTYNPQKSAATPAGTGMLLKLWPPKECGHTSRHRYVTEPMTPKIVRPHQQAQVCNWTYDPQKSPATPAGTGM